MNDCRNKIRLAYYDASDGPRLMMFGPIDVDLRSLQELFRQLASTPGKSIQLDEQPFVAPFAKVKLSSSGRMVDRPKYQQIGLRRLEGLPVPSFEWVRTSEGWDALADLIDGLVKSTKAGHQYMTSYPGEDAIAVVSKGEYTDEVLNL